jgi:acetyl-CoA carboxylase biotin carboxylase subunit
MQRILIANRGEIACRIIRSVQNLGKQAIAVYSEADANAPHRHLADQAYAIGPAPAQHSYLNMEAILRAATASGADGLHPGYGFLAENATFARRCQDAGLTFIGPSPATMHAMGDKAVARQIAQDAGVPIIPGSGSTPVDRDSARQYAADLGYPVLLKAAGGGGGIGMQVVASPEGLDKAFTTAQNRAQAAFGSPALYLEKFLTAPRHVEIQVLGDTHGHLLHCYERECSIQRRHQKVIEEAPSPLLAQSRHAGLRQRMTEAALAVATAVQYVGAGTVEFLVDEAQGFYFIEMNTRLQVEHTVTEMITGIDLVAAQIRIAEGEPLPWRQADIPLHGAALECRLYAENPAKNFLPSPGTLTTWQIPSGPGIRVDSGMQAGMQVTPYYDPLLAKIITHGDTRTQAISRMRQALAAYQVEGIQSNLALHQQIMDNARFQAGALTTSFLADLLSNR